MKESEPIPVNMFWSLVRKKEKPLTIYINGNHCKNEKVIAEKFADHIMSGQNIQPAAAVPQPGQRFSSHYWSFKCVTPEDVRSSVKSQKPKNSNGPDGISPAFLKSIVNGTSANIANLIDMIIASGNCHKSLGLGRIKPIFKGKGSSFNLVSYRPILVKKYWMEFCW